MSAGTPRLRSAFPLSPPTKVRSPTKGGERSVSSARLPDVKALDPKKPEPLITFSVIDAPSQRLYAVGVYSVLLFYRLYDFYNLNLDETESLWLFMKWVLIDGAFLFGLPGLRIPWLEWSTLTMAVLFLLHAILDGILMFRIPIPLGAGLVALSRLLYDREMAISERRVKPADIVHNPSLILGKQIIHVLPEGSATLNPENIPLCLDPKTGRASELLPIQINQTNPKSIELLRYDLDDSSNNETVTIPASQIRRMRKEAERSLQLRPSDPLLLKYQIKKTGLYRLKKIVDETNLEVAGRASEAMVVSCPRASVVLASINKCRGDLSDVRLNVEGTPPLKVTYRKTVVNKESKQTYESIQPDDFVSPLVRRTGETNVVPRNSMDLAWASSYRISVPLNEVLESSGRWTYLVERVTDALDNTVTYFSEDGDEKPQQASIKVKEMGILVHDRPRIFLRDHDLQRPLLVASGQNIKMPLEFASTAKQAIADTKHFVQYKFTPSSSLSSSGDHSESAEVRTIEIQNLVEGTRIKEPGLYTLQEISTPFCSGDILEPMTFMLINPPAPDISMGSNALTDSCAGRPIGLSINLDFEGTPPFEVFYQTRGAGGHQLLKQKFSSSRGIIEFKPDIAGKYSIEIVKLIDGVYEMDLKYKKLLLEQEVKPSVNASFSTHERMIEVCQEQVGTFDVHFQGERPWSLEYEVVHNRKRSKYRLDDITSDTLQISTDPLTSGGEYGIMLTSVTDQQGCRENLQYERHIRVPHQKPKAGFGLVDGKRNIATLEGRTIELPLRLAGQEPWTIGYHRQGSDIIHTMTTKNANAVIRVNEAGVYELKHVADARCAGIVDETAKYLAIDAIQRPTISVPVSDVIKPVQGNDGRFERAEVCEGAEDAMDITLHGRPPYKVKYRERVKLESGAKSVMDREMNWPQNVAQIKMDTSKAGLYEYAFSELGDYNYDHDHKRHRTLAIQQKVNPRPSAAFAHSGKVYSFCQIGDESLASETSGKEELIPITLTGEPPFSVDLELKSAAKLSQPRSMTFPNILTDHHELRIPSRHLVSGTSTLTIRRITDSRKCERVLDPGYGPSLSSRVQISVHDAPTVAPVEDRKHYCVGERIAYSLSGVAPFDVFYTFQGRQRQASESSAVFRRLAELPGTFTITAVQDSASACRRNFDADNDTSNIVGGLTKVIHEMPSVKISKGRESRVEIHVGGQAEILFEFGTGEPPFEFTYTRSENTAAGRRSKRGAVLETKTLISEEKTFRVFASEEGTYEVVAIRDRYCSFAKQGVEGFGVRGSRMLKDG